MPLTKFVEQLKQRLRERKDNYVEVDPWFGSTEEGFHDIEVFDFDKLLKEIDTFSEEFDAKI